MLNFLEQLNNRNIWYRLEQVEPDSIMVTFTLVGMRIEVSFFVDHIEYSVFSGKEDVLDDEAYLMSLVSRHE